MKNLSKKFGLKDLLILIGAGVLFYGVWLIYPPAAYILIGMSLIFLGVR